MYLIHLIFTIIKISILGSLYATFILAIYLMLGLIFPDSFFHKVSRDKKRLWLQSGFVVSVLLIVFSFTYWGRHGLGDNARLPLGYWKSIRESDGTWTTFNHEKYGQIHTIDFAKDRRFVYVKVDRSTKSKLPGEYVIWDLKTNNMTFFKSKDNYSLYAKNNDLPFPNEFEDFKDHYSRYWSGWRFWLLV